MSKDDIVPGSSTISGFFGWMDERHAIWRRRFIDKLPKPWTQDEILMDYKFTNCFRQLDAGTIALTEMMKQPCEYYKSLDGEAANEEAKLIVSNIMYYRFFNLKRHAELFGYTRNFDCLADYMRKQADLGNQIFTGSHMSTGVLGEEKVDTYLRASQEAFQDAQVVVDACKELNTMHGVFDTIRQFYMCGPFYTYEMVCDLRFTPLLCNATDKLDWANVGPGAERGMIRLGLTPCNDTMRLLHRLAVTGKVSNEDDWEVDDQTIKILEQAEKDGCRVNPDLLNGPWPFEIREVEHSLCENDKYERVRLGQGRPRSKYNGRGE